MQPKSQYLNPITLLGILLATSAVTIGLTAFVRAHGGFSPVDFVNHLRHFDHLFLGNTPIQLGFAASIVALIGVLCGRWNHWQLIKMKLIQDAGSTEAGVAINAVDELRRHGLLIEEKGVLSGANLIAADLRGAQLWLANLQDANLSSATMQDVNLLFANLKDSYLRLVDLRNAGLACADLRGAILTLANLEGASLMHANLAEATLTDVQFDGLTILPDGSKWLPSTDLSRFTDPTHPDYWRPQVGSVWWHMED
ncbi:MAG: pentapeptide repeat-containing protein [Anaerolineae bacterium]|nr:pentapeptide repeat-containing protein [Anaerolineae bacterium]